MRSSHGASNLLYNYRAKMGDGARDLVLAICALALIELAAPQLDMAVSYPDRINRGFVTLTCTNSNRIIPLPGAKFQRNGSLLTSDLVTALTDEGNGQVTFNFTQDQEGYFRCVHNGETSREIGLTGSKFMCWISVG